MLSTWVKTTTPDERRRRTYSLAVFVRQEIESRIVRGELEPGSRLEETAVARDLNVSRTPVREAFRQLYATGLIEQTHNRSAVIAKPTRHDLVSLFETTAELEAICAQFAAARMRETDKAKLLEVRDACESMQEAMDRDSYGRINEEFHDLIWQGADNASLLATIQSVRVRLAAYRKAQFSNEARMEESSDEHRRITAAVLDGDTAAAAVAMRAHINNAGCSVLKLLFGRLR